MTQINNETLARLKTAPATPEAAKSVAPAQPPAKHCILFWDDNFNGARLDLYAPSDGNAWGWPQLGDFGDQVTSISIESGTWVFYANNQYNQTVPGYAVTLGPGGYPSVDAVGIPNDSLSSVVCLP
jgi:hypothetical protein